MSSLIRSLGSVSIIGMLMVGFQPANAQSSGQLRFRFEPDKGMQYVLDGKYRMSDHETTLIEGPHRFTFWAPERLMLDTTIDVVPDATTDILVRLRYSQDFVDHRKASQRYERSKRWGTYLPPVVVLGTGAWAVVSILNYGNADKDLKGLADDYVTLSDPAGIQRLKNEEIPAAKSEFSSARTQAYIATGVFVASVAGALWVRHRLANSTAPVFEDKEKLRFEGLVWVPAGQGGTWAGSISLPIR